MDTAIVVIMVILSVGIALIIQPRKCVDVIGRFYSRYPLLRLTGDTQFQIRTEYIVVLGLVIIGVGCFGLYQLITK